MLKFLIVFLLLVPSVAYGHYLQTDNSLGILVHIDPADEPIVGQKSKIFLEINSRNKKFDIEEYECNLEIIDNGIVLQKFALFLDSQNDFSETAVKYVFPHEGSYVLRVSCKDLKHPEESFFSDFNFRAEEGWKRSLPFGHFWEDHILHTIIFGGGFLALFVYYIIDSKKLKKTNE